MTNPKHNETFDINEVNFNFDNSFARELEGFFVPCKASKVPEPSLLIFNQLLVSDD